MQFETGDLIIHKIFGTGTVIETYWKRASVNFDKFWLKVCPQDLLEAKYKKPVITSDPFEEKNNQYRNTIEKTQEKIATNQLD